MRVNIDNSTKAKCVLLSFSLGPYKIPTWTSPLLACVVLSILVSNVSFLGHLCAILVGYLCKFFRFHALSLEG